MKILFDYQTFVEQPYGGISRYIAYLARNITSLKGAKTKISTLLSNNEYLAEEGIGFNFFPATWIPKKLLIMKMINRAYTFWLLKTGKFDIFHATYFEGYYFGKTKIPVVVSVYDMIHEVLYDQYIQLHDDAFIERKKKALVNADVIIAISETTKKDVLKVYPFIPAEKIRVVHLCLMLEGDAVQAAGSSVNFDAPYYLYVGSRGMYKNFEVIVKAMALADQAAFILVCAGGGKFTAEETTLIHNLGLDDRIVYSPIKDDNWLNTLYQHAIAYVSTSAYEGFGLPTLEAFSNKCPVILTDTPCYLEIAGDGAEFFPLTSSEELTRLLIKIAQDEAFRSDMIERGSERLKFFNKTRLVNETVACYDYARSITKSD